MKQEPTIWNHSHFVFNKYTIMATNDIVLSIFLHIKDHGFQSNTALKKTSGFFFVFKKVHNQAENYYEQSQGPWFERDNQATIKSNDMNSRETLYNEHFTCLFFEKKKKH